MAAEVIHNHDVAGTKRGDKDSFDIDLEGLTVDRTLKKPRRLDPIETQRSQERRRVPVTVRDFGFDPSAPRPPSTQWCHVGLGPSLIDEDETLGLDLVLILPPLCAPPYDVGTVALAGHHAFFLKLSFSAWTKFQTVR